MYPSTHWFSIALTLARVRATSDPSLKGRPSLNRDTVAHKVIKQGHRHILDAIKKNLTSNSIALIVTDISHHLLYRSIPQQVDLDNTNVHGRILCDAYSQYPSRVGFFWFVRCLQIQGQPIQFNFETSWGRFVRQSIILAVNTRHQLKRKYTFSKQIFHLLLGEIQMPPGCASERTKLLGVERHFNFHGRILLQLFSTFCLNNNNNIRMEAHSGGQQRLKALHSTGSTTNNLLWSIEKNKNKRKRNPPKRQGMQTWLCVHSQHEQHNCCVWWNIGQENPDEKQQSNVIILHCQNKKPTFPDQAQTSLE